MKYYYISYTYVLKKNTAFGFNCCYVETNLLDLKYLKNKIKKANSEFISVTILCINKITKKEYIYNKNK